LADDAELLARGVPKRTALLIATLAGCHQSTAIAGASAVVVIARLGERQG